MSSSSKARQRITALLDENSFVEIGAKVTARATDFNLKPEQTPSDGVITGYGVIDSNLVFVYSQDVSVLGGSIGEMHARKIASIYDLAIRTGAPVIGLVESAGFRLQEGVDALPIWKSLYKLLWCKFLELNVLWIVYDICNCCFNSCIVLKCDNTFLCKEKKCSCFVCYVVRNCYCCAVRKVLEVLCLACVDAEGFIVNCAY